MEQVKVTKVRLGVDFNIFDDEIDVNDVPSIIDRAVDHAGYALSDMPQIISTEVEYIGMTDRVMKVTEPEWNMIVDSIKWYIEATETALKNPMDEEDEVYNEELVKKFEDLLQKVVNF